MTTVYLAVHGGAGFHHPTRDHEVRVALKKACSEVLDTDQSNTSLEVISHSISVLEDDPALNAGVGSNLTLEGQVECDASIMDGPTGDFGSVGAVSGVKNPIQLARKILENSRIRDPIGRIPPITLVGNGARSFASSSGLSLVRLESMIISRTKSEWTRWKEYLDLGMRPDGVEDVQVMQDTVGAVSMVSGQFAAGVSSGGLLLKYPGRIGEAAVYGAGCWADERSACSVSGTGEYIVRCELARSICTAVRSSGEDLDVHDILKRTLEENFWKPCREQGIQDPNAGVILLTKRTSDDGTTAARLWCAFTTQSMAVGYASSSHPKAKSVVFRRTERERVDETAMPLFVTSLAI